MNCKCAEEGHEWILAEGETIPDACRDPLFITDNDETCWHCGHTLACHPQPIQVWRWEDAPERYRELASLSRGEDLAVYNPASSDLLIFVPEYANPQTVNCLIDSLGSDVYEFAVPEGAIYCAAGSYQ